MAKQSTTVRDLSRGRGLLLFRYDVDCGAEFLGTIRASISCLLIPEHTYFSDRVINVWNSVLTDVNDFSSIKNFRRSHSKVDLIAS